MTDSFSPARAAIGAPDDPVDGGDLAPVFGRVRLRTLIFLRWLAVAGQTATVLGVHFGLGFQLPLAGCFVLIGASAALNAFLPVFVSTQRLARDGEAFAQLAFDLIQLMALLALTGGLANPFAVMIVGPVVISVAALPARWWLSLGALALAGTSGLAVWHLPLPWLPGEVFALPPLYLAATGLALVIAIAFTAIYAWRVAGEARRMGAALAATQGVLAREQRLSALGALAAAAAHELGTPLATIQLTAKEMLRAATDPELKEDAELLVSQAQRCREILQRLSQMRDAGDRMHDRLGLSEAMEEAAAPLQGVGAPISVRLSAPLGEARAPVLRRRVELIYALGNFIENAVDFADTRVIVTGAWTARHVSFTVEDDGPGFPPDILAKLGEPYVTTRQAEPGHGGLGLGVFIAMTLAQRVQGKVTLSNAPGGGARVEITLPRSGLEIED
ncbi:ActS/PrrB/RegB family redox-sensitive histidine kinase [Hyphomonadaceae bacterium BL14]|nr:ActS/PrrB/RegB family redox-sensitive histidine kinase [Hyphomonadaceae bacterium BL14]